MCKTYTIGFKREDGDIQVVATLNNNDELLEDFNGDENVTAEDITFDAAEGIMELLQSTMPSHKLELFERQDSPDYVNDDTND